MPVLDRLSSVAFALAVIFATVPPALAERLPPPRPEGVIATRAPSFAAFRTDLERDAIARGHDAELVRGIVRGLQEERRVTTAIGAQREFVTPIWDYLDGALSDARITRGRDARRRHADTLARIERETGVSASVLLGIWGMETNFGSFMGDHDTFQALANLAHASHRPDYFRDEFMAALTLVERGQVRRAALRGSWAGAIGHTQFMPSNVLLHCADGDGNGRCDLLGSIPDALASSARYLLAHGWEPGLPFGFEITLPEGFDFSRESGSARDWTEAGVTRRDGSPIALPDDAALELLVPAGGRGPVFLVTGNFEAIKRYNPSEAYALGVAYLGERVEGRPGIRAAWPRATSPLNARERREIQETLAGLGFYDGPVNGNLGPMTRAGMRAFQRAQGILADGFPDRAGLRALRAARGS